MPYIPNSLDQQRPQFHHTGAQSRTVKTWPTRLPSQPLIASETHTSFTRNPCTFNFRVLETWVSLKAPQGQFFLRSPLKQRCLLSPTGRIPRTASRASFLKHHSPLKHPTRLPYPSGSCSVTETPALLLTDVNTLHSFSTLLGPHKKSPIDPQTITPKCGPSPCLFAFLHLFQQPMATGAYAHSLLTAELPLWFWIYAFLSLMTTYQQPACFSSPWLK